MARVKSRKREVGSEVKVVCVPDMFCRTKIEVVLHQGPDMVWLRTGVRNTPSLGSELAGTNHS